MKTQIYFFTLLFYEFWYFPFLECIATISKRTTTHFILSHHVRLKVANSHTMSYVCGSWWRGIFTAQYTMVREIFQMRRYGIVKLSKLNILILIENPKTLCDPIIFVMKSKKCLKLKFNHFLQNMLWMNLTSPLKLQLTEPSFQSPQ